MSMINACQQNGVGYLFADTAIVNPTDGTLIGCAPKIAQGSKFPWAIGMTVIGHWRSLDTFAFLDEAETACDLLQSLGVAVDRFKRDSANRGVPGAQVRLVVVAWCGGSETIRTFVAGDGTHEYAPCYWCPSGVFELGYIFGVQPDIAPQVTALWGDGSPNDPACFDVHRDGAEVFEIRRRTPFKPLGAMPTGNYVGGQLMVAEVSPVGVTCGIWREWPDEVGERIGGQLEDVRRAA